MLIFGTIICSNSSMHADQRNFVWTYEYNTIEPGSAEYEQYQTISALKSNDFEHTSSTELNMEFEFGMTEHFDFAIYQIFASDTGGKFSYDGFKLRGRYKIGKKGQFFVDPLLYLEYESSPNFSKQIFEPKLILAKDLGDFTLSLNPYVEIEKEEKEWEITPKYAFGIAYKVTDIFKVGLEAKGDKNANYIGPTISHGKENLWVAFSSQFAVGNIESNKPEFQARLIFGIHL
jgi:hypothetical protein